MVLRGEVHDCAIPATQRLDQVDVFRRKEPDGPGIALAISQGGHRLSMFLNWPPSALVEVG
jgi:hypothetical protein